MNRHQLGERSREGAWAKVLGRGQKVGKEPRDCRSGEGKHGGGRGTGLAATSRLLAFTPRVIRSRGRVSGRVWSALPFQQTTRKRHLPFPASRLGLPHTPGNEAAGAARVWTFWGVHRDDCLPINRYGLCQGKRGQRGTWAAIPGAGVRKGPLQVASEQKPR